ncbi:MAG: septal ring lytic transglycosylase RlpA family protein [Zoogloeaceae bacterium]|nr:septal ring lytic transglycosylase RlpA family protein [Zoogloeaceae bacterium]
MHSSWKTALGICLLPVFLLSGCGGDPVRPTEPAAETPKGTSRTPTRKPSVTLKRGGGFYKDDGPGDDIPDGLDDIPDAVPRFEPLHRFANRPYVVLGKEYLPNTSIKPYKRQGIGSWYGKKFHGQKTSIGETYDMFGMTAAHPTLAIPSYVRVTNVANGRSVIVRVNDRGPFHADRIIDLSYAAAYKLDYIGSGSALVEVETIVPDATGMTYADLRPAPTAQTAQGEQDEIAQMAKKMAAEERPSQSAARAGIASQESKLASGSVFLQLGAFANADNAESLQQKLGRELDWVEGELRINVSGGIHRLHLGPFVSRSEAEKVAERIRQDYGFKPTFVTR